MSIKFVKRLAYSALAISLVQAVAVDRYDLRKRQTYEVQKNVVVVEQVDVVQNPDGSFVTGIATPVSTSLSYSSPTPLYDSKDILPLDTKIAPSDVVQDKAQFNEVAKDEPEKQPGETTDEPDDDPEDDPEEPEIPDPEDQPIVIEPIPTSGSKIEAIAPTQTQAPQTEPIASSNITPQSISANSVPADSNALKSNSINTSADMGTVPSSKVAASSRAKRGIAYNDVNKLSAFTSSSKVSWAYNWGSTTPNIPGNIEYVPMLWGTGGHAEGWNENANKAIASGSTHLLAFNEPDLGAQSSLSVSDAVAGYHQLMQPYAGKAKLGSPAVTNGPSPMGLSYLHEFITACSGCTIDFVAIHWYNGGNAEDFKNYVSKAHAVGGGRPVWITEFEASGDAGQQQAFLNDVLPWLDSQDYVERYAYFMASDGNLISSGTTLSITGQAFAFGN